MKHPSGSVRPRRAATPPRKVRLNLQRRPKPDPEKELDARQEGNFWKWVLWVALFHVLVIGIAIWVYESTPTVKPPEPFISLLPPGNVVKGTPGAQAAHKVGPTTAASVVHHASPPPAPDQPARPKPVTPPAAVFQPPKPAPAPIVKEEAPPLAEEKPKPPKPKPPKVKVDLHLVDGPTPAVTHVAKAKPHHKKVVAKTDDADDLDHEPALKADSEGLSREQIAAKLDAAGVKNAAHSGVSGSADSHASPFADFYAALHDQVMDQWVIPNQIDESATDPVVRIHVEKDGRVPAESVELIHSSGDQAYDDSAVTAAKNLGMLHEPLPDGCPPDISITFHPNR